MATRPAEEATTQPLCIFLAMALVADAAAAADIQARCADGEMAALTEEM